MTIRITLDSLIVLDAIDRNGSFAGAAEELHRVPSAITYAVQKLEQDLDLLLFDRRGHRAVLTDAGRELLAEGRRLLGAAAEIESRVRRVATGYEIELRIAVSDLIRTASLVPLLRDYYGELAGTRLRLLTEVYGGTWDALVNGRADLALGVPEEAPAGGGFATQPLGIVRWVFAVAPDHPLAQAAQPIPRLELLRHRAVSAADSSRNLPPRTSGLISGQDVLTVPDMRSKLELQRAGIGAGFLPEHLVRADLASGRLVTLRTEEPKPDSTLLVAWRSTARGKALRWVLQRLNDPTLRAALLS